MSHPPHQQHTAFPSQQSFPTPSGGAGYHPPPPGPPGQAAFPTPLGGAYPSPPVAPQAGFAPPFAGGQGAVAAQLQNIMGSFEGVQYKIDHRDSNSVLAITLPAGGVVKSKPGAMVTMSGTVQIKGGFKKKISLGAVLTGGELSESSFTGPGEVLLAPEIWGDVFAISVQPDAPLWSVGKGGYLASTVEVSLSTKSQGLKQGLCKCSRF